jgi:asparagine synthase (glutamine-hydrolysing)
MGGIVGLWHMDGRPVDRSQLATLSRAAPHRALDGEDFWIGAGAGLGHQHARVTPESLDELQPLVQADVAISFDGRLDNRDDLVERCRREQRARESLAAPGVFAAPGVSDAALALGAYACLGVDFVGHLNGEFVLALIDPARHRLILARDMMGARPLYYCALPDSVVFASEIKSILAHPGVAARPDENVLADLLLNGYYDGAGTCFKGICGVQPGQLVIITPGAPTPRTHSAGAPIPQTRSAGAPNAPLRSTSGSSSSCSIEVRRHWDFSEATVRHSSFEEYEAAFQSLFRQAVRRRLRSAHPVAVSVSGGVDSSAVFCQAAALRQGDEAAAPVYGFTMTFPDGTPASETDFVDAIRDSAHGSRAPIHRLPCTSFRLLANAERAIWHLEMPQLLWDARQALSDRARRAGCRVMLDGFFGDQMLGGQAYLVDEARRGHWLTVRRNLQEVSHWTTDAPPGFYRQQFRRDLLRSIAPRSLVGAARTLRGRWRSVERYPSWYARSFRQRALERALDRPRAPRPRASLHAEQCYRFATSPHYLALLQQGTQAGWMHGLELSCPFRDRDLVAFVMAIPGEIVNWRGVPKGLLRHALNGVLPDGIRRRRSKADFTTLNNEALLAERPAMLRLLGRDSVAAQAGLVDAAAIQDSLEGLPALVDDRDVTLGWKITGAVALELWLRVFMA